MVAVSVPYGVWGALNIEQLKHGRKEERSSRIAGCRHWRIIKQNAKRNKETDPVLHKGHVSYREENPQLNAKIHRPQGQRIDSLK